MVKIETSGDYFKKFNSLEQETIRLRNDLIADVNRLASAYPDAVIGTINNKPIKAETLVNIEAVKNLGSLGNGELIRVLDAIQHHVLQLTERRQLELFN